MIALCTYSLEKCCAVEIVDVIRNHEFALIKQSGQWEIFDNSLYKITKDALANSQKHLNDPYRSMREGFARHEIVYDEYGRAVDYTLLDINQAYEQITNLKAADIIGRKASEVHGPGTPPYLEIFAPVAETGEAAVFETYFAPMDKHFSISVFSADRGFFATIFSDITKVLN